MKRRRKLTFHHLTPKSRGGHRTRENGLMLTRYHHDLWHNLFGNLTLEEIIEALQRIQRRKRR